MGAATGTRAENGVGRPGAGPSFVEAHSGSEVAASRDHVLVELTRSGVVRVTGLSRANGVPAYLAPPLFASLPQAILAAHQWAEDNGVGYVFLKDCTAD